MLPTNTHLQVKNGSALEWVINPKCSPQTHICRSRMGSCLSGLSIQNAAPKHTSVGQEFVQNAAHKHRSADASTEIPVFQRCVIEHKSCQHLLNYLPSRNILVQGVIMIRTNALRRMNCSTLGSFLGFALVFSEACSSFVAYSCGPLPGA